MFSEETHVETVILRCCGAQSPPNQKTNKIPGAAGAVPGFQVKPRPAGDRNGARGVTRSESPQGRSGLRFIQGKSREAIRTLLPLVQPHPGCPRAFVIGHEAEKPRPLGLCTQENRRPGRSHAQRGPGGSESQGLRLDGPRGPAGWVLALTPGGQHEGFLETPPRGPVSPPGSLGRRPPRQDQPALPGLGVCPSGNTARRILPLAVGHAWRLGAGLCHQTPHGRACGTRRCSGSE